MNKITLRRETAGRVWHWSTSNGKGGYCATKRDAENDGKIALGCMDDPSMSFVILNDKRKAKGVQ